MSYVKRSLQDEQQHVEFGQMNDFLSVSDFRYEQGDQTEKLFPRCKQSEFENSRETDRKGAPRQMFYDKVTGSKTFCPVSCNAHIRATNRTRPSALAMTMISKQMHRQWVANDWKLFVTTL